MQRAVIGRAMMPVLLVACLSAALAGQSRPPAKKPTAKVPENPTVHAMPAAAATDLKIRTSYSSGAQMSENTTYVKGARRRVEFPGAVTIEQGDLGRTLLINPETRTYLVVRSEQAPDAATAAAPAVDPPQAGMAGGTPASKPGGLVSYSTTLADTGERKQMFGREARRITTVIAREPSASACDQTRMTVEVDGWYVDLASATPGATRPAPLQPAAPAVRPDGCVDRVETRAKGEARLAFPVASTTTTRTGEGDKQETTTSSMEVTALEVKALDAALFDVPSGYTEVRTNAELVSTFETAGGLSRALLGSTADGTGSAAPKRPGAIRVGVLEPVDKSTHNLPTRELRQELAANFQKVPFEALTLAGNSATESQAEAARMECDYVLYSEIADIRTSKPGKVGGLLKKVTRDGPARDVHEVKLAYKLYRVGGTPAAPALDDSTKASSGGGFDIHAALRMAMFAGSLYMRFTGLGLLNPALLANFGGGLGPLAASGMFDPRVTAMSSMTRLLTAPGMEALANAPAAMPGLTPNAPDPETEIRQTVDAALANAAKGTMEQLKKNNRK